MLILSTALRCPTLLSRIVVVLRSLIRRLVVVVVRSPPRANEILRFFYMFGYIHLFKVLDIYVQHKCHLKNYFVFDHQDGRLMLLYFFI